MSFRLAVRLRGSRRWLWAVHGKSGNPADYWTETQQSHATVFRDRALAAAAVVAFGRRFECEYVQTGEKVAG